MAKLTWAAILIGLLLLTEFALGFSVEYLAETSVASDFKFKKTTIGGLSGMSYADGILMAVSDDRGKFAEPRIYKFSLSLEKTNVHLKPADVLFVKDLPEEQNKLPNLDLEGLVQNPDGSFILSSEGDNNKKPRQMPRIFETDKMAKWTKDISVPALFLPEKAGLQTKGISNNSGFEGLTLSPSGKTLFAAVEAPLVQDESLARQGGSRLIRLVKFEKLSPTSSWQETAQYAYKLEDLSQTDQGPEVFRGVSEILALSDDQILVLERGVRIFGKDLLNITAALYKAELKGATPIQSFEKLPEKNVIPLRKAAVVDFEKDLKTTRGEKKVQNFEALSWGPALPDGRKTLLVLSDNNFSKKEITELLIFAVSFTVKEDLK